ncbi:COBW domain-containing protein 1 [Coemansia interrupta]|uniref:COBW domain-containing protein 1 n=1 Tax=Coemansia interrupta TaxID=1126814 RepID=A0A9W8LKA6_9FUNG|nr:COBW domain-containing protein 1 [Coemansia interrupta]
MNEFGDSQGIDQSFTSVSNGAMVEDWLDLKNGCLCCTVKDKGLKAIETLMERKGKFDYILLETTGLADPGNIAAMLWSNEELGSDIRLDGVVTMVDSKNILRQLDETPPEGETMNEVQKQLAFADRIVLNKVDLVSDETVQTVRTIVEAINGTADVSSAEFAKVDLDSILGIGAYTDVALGNRQFSGTGHHHIDRNISTMALEAPGQLRWSVVDEWIQELLWDSRIPGVPGASENMEILRLKALLLTADFKPVGTDEIVDRATVVIQGVREMYDSFVVPDNNKMNIENAASYRVVLIGRCLPKDALLASWGALLKKASCKEFVVGSVQGELAIFRGRGGCGSWRHSEEQIDPEYDCWDAVERGEFPSDVGFGSYSGDPTPSMRRHSTFASLVHSAASNRESLSVDDIMNMFDGTEHVHAQQLASLDASEDDGTAAAAAAAALAGSGAKGAAANPWDPEYTGHIKWEDALDLERDGRKPWILAQKLGTISSVVVADISNSGHNSVVVVNGEGKCHIFDYPFKRRLHPDMAKRKRQRNHYRRFSQDRFFKNGVIVDPLEAHEGGDTECTDHLADGAAAAAAAVVAAAATTTTAPHPANDLPQGEQLVPLFSIQSDTGAASLSATATAAKRPAFHRSRSTFAEASTSSAMYDYLSGQPSEKVGDPHANNVPGIPARSTANDIAIAKPGSKLGSGTENKLFDRSQGGYLVPNTDAMHSASNLSSQADQPLAIFGKREGKEAGSIAFEDLTNRQSTSPMAATAAATGVGVSGHGGFSNETTSSGRRQQQRPAHHHLQSQHREASDAGIDSLSAAYGDGDIESDQDYADVLSDIGDNAVLTEEEVADIEKIWGANIGKKSGDWFPFVLDQPDMTFAIPTNVEHALVSDIDNNGLNELVLTATDGFVYIFRIEPSVKHAVKPALTSVGVFSNNPTTLPSVNMTGNGSPYLYMSAPRSPDTSDLDLEDPVKGLKIQAAGNRLQKSLAERQQLAAAAPPPPTMAATQIVPDVDSDISLVNHLIKSIKDGSAPPATNRSGESAVYQHSTGSSSASAAVVTHPQVPSHKDTAILPSSGRLPNTGRRMSLTGRMRENFTGIVSGWDPNRKPGPSVTHTAPPSINHSRNHTANNSGTSTNAHSRVPSIGEGEVDMDQVSVVMDPSPSAVPSAEPSSSSSAGPVSRHYSAHISPATSVSAVDSRIPRTRHGAMGIGALDVVEEIPERKSNEMESRNESEPCDSLPTAQVHEERPCTLSRDPSISEVEPLSSEELISPVSSSGQLQDPTSVSGLVDSLAHHRRVGSTGSRTNSRAGGLIKAIGGSGGGSSSRGHSRQGSFSSTVKARVSSSSTSIHAVGPSASHVANSESAAEPVQTLSGEIDSRRTSLGSIVSGRDDSIYNNSGSGQQAALPLEVTVSARGSFSKPSYPTQPPRPTDMDDNNSVISQVTERLTELTKKANDKAPIPTIAESPVAIVPASSRAKSGNALYEPFDGDFAATRLPPPRNIVDWSTTTADKVATWFLDNIPGNVAVVNAPAKAFGSPLTKQRRDSDSDDFSDYTCSECSCSECGDGDSGSESSESVPNHLMQQKVTPSPKQPVTPAAIGRTLPEGSMKYPEVTLPQPLGLHAISKSRDSGSPSNPSPDIKVGDAEDQQLPATPREPVPGEYLSLSDNAQRFLILSKPGGRFVPIDMVNGAMMATVEPPQVPMSIMTGGNTALMNVGSENALRNMQLAISVGLSVPQLSGFDYTAISGSFMGQSSSWQSGSIPWSHNVPLTSESCGSDPNMAKSPVSMHDTSPSIGLSNVQRASADSTSGVTPLQTSPAHQSSTEEPLVSQFPSSNVSKASITSLSPPQASMPQHHHHQEYGMAAPASASSSRQSQSSLMASSVFNSGVGSGPASLSSNLRSMRSIQRLNSDGQRAQNFNPGHGPSPIYRGISIGGSATPMVSGFPATPSHYERRHLGFAGLRGYIGNGNSRQRPGGITTNMRTDDGGVLSGYFTPVTSGQASVRGQGVGPAGQGVGSGIMPREPPQGHASSVSTTASISQVADRGGRAQIGNVRQHSNGRKDSPGAVVSAAPTSPQRNQQVLRYSPSMAGWSSYKDTGMLSTIRDQEDVREAGEPVTDQPSRVSQVGPAERLSSEPLPSLPGSGAQTPAMRMQDPSVLSPFTDDISGRGYWMNTEPPSVRSHSSLGTGISTSQLQISDEKEEEIEEAPQPMELDVATYMVGGVAAGKRQRRRIRVGGEPITASTRSDATANDSDDEEAYELNELVSLVTMDGVISCYDPVRKVNHFVSLSSKDPVLGIWKVKMHDDLCCPSTISTTLQSEGASSDNELRLRLLASSPAKKVYRRVGLSSHDLLYAVRYSTYIEDRVAVVNRLESHRRRQAKRQMKKIRSHPRLAYAYGAMTDEKPVNISLKRDTSSPGLSRSNTASRINKPGLNSRIRENLNKYHRVGRVVRNLGSHIMDFATSSGISTQQSTTATTCSTTGLMFGHSSQRESADDALVAARPASDIATPEVPMSAASNRRLTAMQPREQNIPRTGLLPSATLGAAASGVPYGTLGSNSSIHGGRRAVIHDGDDDDDEDDDGNRNIGIVIGHSLTSDDSSNDLGNSTDDDDDDDDSDSGLHHNPDHQQQSQRQNQQQHQQSGGIFGPASSGSNHINSSNPTSAIYHSGYLGATPLPSSNRLYGADIAAALNGWYGENKNDYRRSLRVSDHLVVSTWRGTTYFVDVSNLLDTAHYNDLFMHRWNTNVASAAERAVAAAEASDKNGSVGTEPKSCNLASVYGHLSEFTDVTGIMSRLRANASVIQFKFQDTVSAFLADTYAPATGGPNVPCIFYVDYKDRIWAYYHLDEVAEMDDVYGASWLEGEPEKLHTPATRAHAIEGGIDPGSHNRPFSVVDLAYRRINQEPWIPLIGDETHRSLVNYGDCSYPYSSKTWRKRVDSSGRLVHDFECQDGQPQPVMGAPHDGSSLSPSDTSTQAFITQANANITGRFHMSYVPGPYLCPIWADINSVDLYDVGACNLLELVTPDLLAVKDMFCKDLGLDPESIDERVSLATIPKLSTWVRQKLFSQK